MLQNKEQIIDRTKDCIALDSNVFRNLDFINYLTLKKSEINIFIPTIVQLEVGYYYIGRGISWEAFKKDIQKFSGIFLQWNNDIIPKVIKRAYDERINLPFRHHFRDFVIGVECEKISINLISYNKNHFTWLKGIKCYTPEEYLYEKLTQNEI